MLTVGSVKGDPPELHPSDFVKVKRGSSNFIPPHLLLKLSFILRYVTCRTNPDAAKNQDQTMTPLRAALCSSCETCFHFSFFNVIYFVLLVQTCFAI